MPALPSWQSQGEHWNLFRYAVIVQNTFTGSFVWTNKLKEKMNRYISLFCNYDLGRDYDVVVNETEKDLGEDPIITTAQQLITLTKSFIIL